MRFFINCFALVGAVLALSACQMGCTKTSDYKGDAYSAERTAGTGVEADYRTCNR